MMTPTSMTIVEEAKENRLTYLASIPIASFDDSEQQQPTKSKSAPSVRFDLSPQPTTARTRIIQKQQIISKDFLQDFPLLRALVQEALTLQKQHHDIPTSLKHILFDQRPHSVEQNVQRKLKSIPRRPTSATISRSTSIRNKSVIVTRNNNNIHRLYPPPPERRHIVTSDEVRNLVDRLSKPKFNKRIEREITLAEQMIVAQETIKSPRLLPPPPPVRILFFL